MPLFFFAMFILVSAMAFAVWELLSVHRARDEHDRRIPANEPL